MNRVLVIDDDNIIRESICEILELEKITSTSFSTAEKGLSFLRYNTVNAVIMDLKLPKMDGLEALSEIKKIDPDLPVIMITGYGNTQITVKAIKLGAYDFITKPFDETGLILSLNKAIDSYVIKKDVIRLSAVVDTSLTDTLGKSPAMIEIIKQLHQISQSNMSVILQGETGIGKSYFAKIIHTMSNRRKNQFVKVDIASLSESLIESELFGHAKGSFSGAYSNKIGYFETASGGTIFLDDIQNMSIAVQSKLLNVIEDRTVYLVGSSSPIKVDVRIISATNKDLQKNISEKQFREDLYHRLNEYILTIPPLRERKEDIELFTWKFIKNSEKELNRRIKIIPKETLDILINHPWHGNIRELRNVIRRAMINATDDTLRPEHFDFLVNLNQIPVEVLTLKSATLEAEIKSIVEALKTANGNKTIAAKILKISYRGLLNKISNYKI